MLKLGCVPSSYDLYTQIKLPSKYEEEDVSTCSDVTAYDARAFLTTADVLKRCATNSLRDIWQILKIKRTVEVI